MKSNEQKPSVTEMDNKKIATTIRYPKNLQEKIKVLASLDRRPYSWEIAFLLKSAVSAREGDLSIPVKAESSKSPPPPTSPEEKYEEYPEYSGEDVDRFPRTAR